MVHPLSAIKLHSKSRTKKVIAATWVIPLVLATPYLFSKSYPFSIHSDHGSLSRQICTDRFDDIDKALYGDDPNASGRFRRGFFMFLFIFVYLIPMIVIAGTCINMSISLLKPVQDERDNEEGKQGRRISQKREENKRKVKIQVNKDDLIDTLTVVCLHVLILFNKRSYILRTHSNSSPLY